MRATRLWITGAAGFNGSHIAEQRIQPGWDVTGVDDLSGGFMENVLPGVHFLRETVSDARVEETARQERE